MAMEPLPETDHTKSLFELATSPSALLRAWQRVSAKTPRAKWPPAMLAFESSATATIDSTSGLLQSMLFVPEPRQHIRIPKPSGGYRSLELPTLRDRVVERAVHDALMPIVDAHLSPLSVAYRPGVGVAAAERVIAELRAEGFTHALKADIVDCFGSIAAEDAISELGSIIEDEPLIALLRLLCQRVHEPRTVAPRGLAQGSPLSPLLSNVYLDRLDQLAARRSLVAVRYADDLLVLTRGADQLEPARHALDDIVSSLGLSVAEPKLRQGELGESMTFLGARFTPLPNAADHEAPEQSTLYIGDRNAYVTIKAGRVEVRKKADLQLSIPQTAVKRLVTFGPVGVSAGVRQWALCAGVDWVCLSERGGYLGSIASHSPQSVRRRMRQSQRRGQQVAIDLARCFVDGKIANSIALLRRFSRLDDESDAQRTALSTWRVRLKNADKPGSLLGVEGLAAAQYWAAFATRVPDELGFVSRRRRPPPDAVNSALSYAYAMLAGEATGAVASAGLDPAMGFLHRERDGRASLAYDLMEEFRPLIVDTTVMELARRGGLNGDFGAMSDDGFRLSQAGKALLVKRFERRMTTLSFYTPGNFRCSYRQALHLQAQAVARSVDEGICRYSPVGWRV